MRDQQPACIAAQENIRGLDSGFVESIRKRGGDVLGASYPGDIAFHAHL